MAKARKDEVAPPAQEGEPTDFSLEAEVLPIGIDLGTSRSAITAGNGTRKFVESIVGWPKDAIAARRLHRPILYGRDAMQNRLSLHVYRPLEKGVFKADAGEAAHQVLAEEFRSDPDGNRRAANELLHHLVMMAGAKRDEKLCGVVGVPSQANEKNKTQLLSIAQEYLDRVLIVSQPFAVAYGIGMLDLAIIVDIGAGTTDLCRMHGSLPNPEDQITLPIAGDDVDVRFLELIRKNHPEAQVSINMVKELKERASSLIEGGKDRVVTKFPVDGVPTEFDVTREMMEACSLLIEPVAKGIHQLIATHHPEFQDAIRENILLSGGGSLLPGLPRRLEDALAPRGGGRVSRVEEPLYAGADGALKLAADMPEEYWNRAS